MIFLLWTVLGVYAPNLPSERTMIWRSMNFDLSLSRPGLMVGDFNACCDIGQSTSIHSSTDASELHAWVQMQSSVLQRHAWQ